MCGIAGIVAPQSGPHYPPLERMMESLRHRGPDGSGMHIFPGCALGHTRLSIVDLATGDQPMIAANGRVGVTFNGEIYGYQEIKRKLTSYPFRTSSDTELILALYELYGSELLRHLPGMFAFALWDETRQTLFAARDRFGEKPFYYARGERGEFLFASEIKALLASGLLQPKINRDAVAHYLRHLYIHPHQTVYHNIYVLPPAHCLSLQEGRLSVERYWHLPPYRESLTEHEAIEEFRRLFDQAVKRQLVADVPVGAFLSGGLDSSSIVAVASRSYRRLKTFSFGFGEAINELPYAREVAQLYQTEHTELEDQHADIADLLSEMARVYDEPFADSSNIPTYLISQAAARYGKVVLTGDGGDELLAGYGFWYRPLWEMEQSRSYSPLSVSLMRRATHYLPRLGLEVSPRWQQIIRGSDLRRKHPSIAQAHLAQNTFFGDEELALLGITGGRRPTFNGELGTATETVNDALRMDLCDYMPGDILLKTDRASMAHGLELRAPFLDVDFASFCISLPSRLKINADQDKYILRQGYGAAWPEAVRRRGKCGFGAPVSEWLKRASVINLKKKIFDHPEHPLFTLVSYPAARDFAARDNYQTWILLTLGLWLAHGREGSL